MRLASAFLVMGMLLLAFLSHIPLGEGATAPRVPSGEGDIKRCEGAGGRLEEISSLSGRARRRAPLPPRYAGKGDELREEGFSACYSNVTEHEGDLVIREKMAVIRDCKFILRGSLVLEKASLLIENASLLLAPPPSLALPNITLSSSSLLANKSIIGTTDLLMMFPFFISSSGAEVISSSLYNTSISCLNSIIIMTNSTIKKSLDVRGSSNILVNSTELEEMALRNFSSAVLKHSQLDYLALWFGGSSELTISDLRPGYLRLWDPELNGTVKTIHLSVRLEDCWVSSWGIGAVDSAIIGMLSCELEDVGAYDMAMVDIIDCHISYGVLARRRASIDVISSWSSTVQVLETAAIIVTNSSIDMVSASGKPYVELRNSTITFFSAKFSVRAKAFFTIFDDVDMSYLGLKEAVFTNCTIRDAARVMGFCSVSFWNSTINKLSTRGSAKIRLYDCSTMNLTVKEQARIEVLWSLAISVLLDGFPIPGADVIAFFRNGTEAASCRTGRGGYCKLYLMESLIKADGIERLGPYDLEVSYGLFWTSTSIDPVEPSRLTISFKSLVELETICLDAGGESLEGAQVILFSEGGLLQNATTDGGGLALLTDIPPGNYTIKVFWLGVEVAETSITIHGLDEAITLSCDVIDVLILVMGPSGPVEGASISLELKEVPHVRLAYETNSSGWACLEDIIPGRYELVVEAQGFKTYACEKELTSYGQVLEISLEPLPSGEEGLIPTLMLAIAVPSVLAACGAIIIMRHKKKAPSSLCKRPHYPSNNV